MEMSRDGDKFSWLALISEIEKEQEKKKQPPRNGRITHFVAIRIENPTLRDSVEDIQNRIGKKFPSLIPASTAALALHVTLLPLNLITNEEVEKAKEVFLELGESSRLLNPIALKIQGLNRFGSRVLFCDFDKDTKERLRFLAKHIGQTFYDNQLTESKNVKNYNPHVTVMKMSKVRKKKRLIDREVFECAKKTEIGVVHDAVSIDFN